VGWPGTEASIPAGWSRVAALDGKFLRGHNGVGYGTTGGAATHTHSHMHDGRLKHTHPIEGTSDAAGADVVSTNRNPSAVNSLIVGPHSHTHNANLTSELNNDGYISGAALLTAGANDPPYWTVIWIESDGSTGIPDGALTFGVSIPTGWAWPEDYRGFFLKGAAASSGGGAQGAYPTGHEHGTPVTHDHSIGAHTHPYSDLGLGVLSPDTETPIRVRDVSGSGVTRNQSAHPTQHSHVLYVDWRVGPIGTAPAETSGSEEVVISLGYVPLPGFRHLYLLRNDTGGGSLPVGIIVAYRGGSVPAGWQRLSYMQDRTPRGISVAGELGYDYPSTDSTTHYHTLEDHIHQQSNHSHPTTMYTDVPDTTAYIGGGGSSIDMMDGHTHGQGSIGLTPGPYTMDTTPIDGLGNSNRSTAVTSVAPYYTVMYIQYLGSPGKVVSYLNPITSVCEVLTNDTDGRVVYRRGSFSSSPEITDIPIVATLEVDGTPEAIIVLPDGTRVAMLHDSSGVRRFVSFDYGHSWEEE
jgi:hypothetical protein